MSTILCYPESKNSGLMSDSHQFYSSDGRSSEMWNSIPHTAPGNIYIDSAAFAWPETDVAEYSPGTYSDSDHQTIFSSGLSSSSSPADILDFEPDHYAQMEDWNQRAAYAAGLSPLSDLHNSSDTDSPVFDPELVQAYLSDTSAYKLPQDTSSVDTCIDLSQLIGTGVQGHLSVPSRILTPRSAKSATSVRSNCFKLGGGEEGDNDDNDDDEDDDYSYPSSSDYHPSPSPKAEQKPSVRYHPYGTANKSRDTSRVNGTMAYRTVSTRTQGGSIPVPVPIPNLTKKSRGRKVPTVFERELEDDGDDGDDSDSIGSMTMGRDFSGSKVRRSRGGGSNSTGTSTGTNGKRMYRCAVEDCGKCFVRGEHLKRHVRSIHTNEKPHHCPYEGCNRTFSRRDNLGQHQRVHGI